MKRIKLFSRKNGGDESKIEALLKLYPYLAAICGDRRISPLQMIPSEELPTYEYIPCAMAYNCEGRVYLIKDGAITAQKSWDETRMRRRTLGLREPFNNSPQAELVGDEDACVLVQHHYAEGDEKDNWISVDVFMCPPGHTFQDFPLIRTWIAEVAVVMELREAGFVR
ncbi:MAG: hypothetical protein A2942_02370 [Candidatus Lloydbacteria bacterium RIFCSPLOWO2_01_FULL_50_20]|uniref:Uncharacterized protein n=1 Tax=Candidatus Lloydbacteria bacterium RIFCSPLOWO2_01_FULL_50_20 TaxID=1798665 RepID=A0A1G2DM50_9BACT|nr:MAG: hypothetical protein A2942_02370 [Candidatus Lloydbacteria bacterium RIFCSPLOWO2_01_FULL_50_20]